MRTSPKLIILILATFLFFASCEQMVTTIPNPVVQTGLDAQMRKDGWDLGRIDTAREVNYLSAIEEDVILATNALRTDPQKFNNLYVKPYKGYYQEYGGRWFIVRPGRIPISTVEGLAPVNELITELETQRKLPLLSPSLGISRASKDHANDQARTGALGHTGADGSDPRRRMQRYGSVSGYSAENISYGPFTGLDIIISLLIDDDVQGRGHRRILLENGENGPLSFTKTGVGVSYHPNYRVVAVINYAGGYREK